MTDDDISVPDRDDYEDHEWDYREWNRRYKKGVALIASQVPLRTKGVARRLLEMAMRQKIGTLTAMLTYLHNRFDEDTTTFTKEWGKDVAVALGYDENEPERRRLTKELARLRGEIDRVSAKLADLGEGQSRGGNIGGNGSGDT